MTHETEVPTTDEIAPHDYPVVQVQIVPGTHPRLTAAEARRVLATAEQPERTVPLVKHALDDANRTEEGGTPLVITFIEIIEDEKIELSEENIEVAAAAAHEANRVWCFAHGDDSQLPWAEAEEWQRASAVEGVRGVLAGNTPEDSHKSWLAVKEAAGWVYGPTKNIETKTHPCMVPYEELSETDRLKDDIFVGTVTTFVNALRVAG